MYDNKYREMVEAGIAEELEEEITHEEGLPTKFKLTHPDYLLFVDKTGCNTNQLNDGKVGREVFIMPKNSGDAAAPAGATTDIHFTDTLNENVLDLVLQKEATEQAAKAATEQRKQSAEFK